MTKIAIELVDSMGDDLRVANVARVSFNKWKEEFDNKDARLIDYLASHEHLSPFRHTAISIRCKAPVFLARQLGKHQAGLSWNEVSRRYVDAGIEFFVPDNWRSRPTDGIKQGSGDIIDKYEKWTTSAFGLGATNLKTEYQYLVHTAIACYDNMISYGVAPEMARMVLPQSMMVDWVWTGNLLSMFHIYRLRIGEGSQEEAKEFAKLLEEVVQPIFPHCWSALKGDSNEIATN